MKLNKDDSCLIQKSSSLAQPFICPLDSPWLGLKSTPSQVPIGTTSV